MGWLGALLLILFFPATPAAAQQIATSPAPQKVSVTVYRAPGRPAAQKIELGWLNGYALISETRRVSLPAGEVDLRFEGVAGGILPESAIVTGLPSGVVEKNQDAWLLSPASLIERSLGRRVHLRRTSRATGEVRELEAVVRSGPEGAVVLETPQGFEALRCTGLAETVVYDRVPPGLSAKPTLSVRVRSSRRVNATVTLSYLAAGFDWQADYVARLSADETRLDLFAWLTLANGDETGFRNADTLAVAGRVNRSYTEPRRPRAEPLRLECWPQGSTSDVPEIVPVNAEEIIVTGSRIVRADLMAAPPPPPPPPPPAPAIVAEQEELGDLKLYRVPEPVTVAAKSQKQVALLTRSGIKVEARYRQRFSSVRPQPAAPPRRVLVVQNRTAEGLGLPLPSGWLALFTADRGRPVLLGRGFVPDKAVGEEVEIEVGASLAVQTQVRDLRRSDSNQGVEIIVTNARAEPVRYEAEFETDGAPLAADVTLGTRNGRPLWSVLVPPNGSATLRYRP
jgi:hypothetical protein